MKFACDRCDKKYVLADDKIAAKEDVRLKCRQCGNVIVVKQAGEIVAKTPATPVPRLPLPEGALPPPAMPPQFKRASSREAPVPSSDEQTEEPVRPPVSGRLRASAPESRKVSATELSLSGPATLRSLPVEGTSEVDPHSETIPELMRPSGGMLPRPSSPRLGPGASKRPSVPTRATRSTKPAARPATDARQTPPSEQNSPEPTGAEGDRDATLEPMSLGAISEHEPPAPEARGERAASVPGLLNRLWLGAGSPAEKWRMLVALGVGFVLGALFGLVF